MVSEATDDVDRIVQAWSRERPDLDVSPLEILSRVTRIAKHVDRFRKDAFRASRLESWEFDVLAALRRAGKPYRLSPTALMAETLVSSGAMTHRLTKLEARGFISRTADPDDGRGVVVSLTKSGLSALDTAFSNLLSAEHQLVASLSAEQQRLAAKALRALNHNIQGR